MATPAELATAADTLLSERLAAGSVAEYSTAAGVRVKRMPLAEIMQARRELRNEAAEADRGSSLTRVVVRAL